MIGSVDLRRIVIPHQLEGLLTGIFVQLEQIYRYVAAAFEIEA